MPKNANVTFDVDVSPSEYGAHSAILRLDDPANPGIEYQTMNTVIVPHDFEGPDFSVSIDGTIDIAQAQHFFFRVPAGVPALKVDLAGGSELPGTGQISGTCVIAAQNADGDSNETVTINNPAAGRWQVLVDGFAVPAGNTEYDYVDVFANPMFGSVAVTDADALRAPGASWNVPGSVVANANPNIAPDTGRVLLGNVQVRTDTNILIGSGDVIVESVSGP